MPSNGETIEQFFEQAELAYSRLEANVWRADFRGRIRDFTILLWLWGQWLIIQTVLLYAPNPACTRQLYEQLLRLNAHMHMAKFGLGKNGEIMLIVELPLEDLDFSEFAIGIRVLSTNADQSYLEIANLAMQPPPPDAPPAGTGMIIAPPRLSPGYPSNGAENTGLYL